MAREPVCRLQESTLARIALRASFAAIPGAIAAETQRLPEEFRK